MGTEVAGAVAPVATETLLEEYILLGSPAKFLELSAINKHDFLVPSAQLPAARFALE